MGTNSIGWAVMEEKKGFADKPSVFTLIDKGVHIFSEGVKNENGKESSKAAERTGFRAARRIKYRRKLRKYETLKVLIKHKMCPLSPEALEKWRYYKDPNTGKSKSFKIYPKDEAFLNWLKTDNQGIKESASDKEFRKKGIKNPYYFRDKFSREKYDWQNDENIRYELGRAFYHLAQRRGFKSNRFEITDDEAFADVKSEIEELVKEINDIETLKNEIEKIQDRFIGDNDDGEEEITDERIIRLFKSIEKNFPNERKKRSKKKDKASEPLTIETIKENIRAALNRQDNMGDVERGIKDLSSEMKEEGCETLGQLFYKKYRQNLQEGTEKKNIRKRYTDREQHYINEFECICKKQGLKEIDDKKTLPEEKYSGIVLELYKAIFFQRPLKSQKGLVGKCRFEKNKPRCPVSHPAFEVFRALSFINNIRYKSGDDWKPLDETQRKSIWPLFVRKGSPNFDFREIAKIINPDYPQPQSKAEPDPDKQFFNYKGLTPVPGCPTIAALKNVFGSDWENELFNKLKSDKKVIKKRKWLNANEYTRTDKVEREKTKEEVINDIWHVLFTFDSKQKLKEFAMNSLNCDEKTAEKFSNIRIKREYASLSLRAIRNILPYLREGYIFTYAAFLGNMEAVLGKEIWKKPENQKLVKELLPKIIETWQEEKKKTGIVNDLISYFNANYRNADKNYTLGKQDKEEVLNKIKETYGNKTFEAFEETKQQSIIDWVEKNYEKQLRKRGDNKGEFMEIERLDDVIIKELENIFGKEKVNGKKLYHPSDIDVYPQQKPAADGIAYLGSPIIPSIKNPMAMRALHQLRKLINRLLKECTIDNDTRIHIELARQLNDANQRKAIERFQRERDAENKIIKEIIVELFRDKKQVSSYEPQPDDFVKVRAWTEQIAELKGELKERSEQSKKAEEKDNLYALVKNEKEAVTKYRLWQEQEGICIYTGKQIPLHKLFDGLSFDIEHTLPRALSQDNSMENKTIADTEFNRQKKGTKLPSELPNHKDILARIVKWKSKAKDYEQLYNSRAKPRGIETKKQKDKRIQQKHYFKMHWEYWKGKYERFTMKEIKKGFKNSQKVDIGIITKYAREYLYSVFPSVFAYKGELVAEFRKRWGLQEQYEKDRSNHIHHTIDAITIACMTKEKYDLLAHAWGLEDDNKKKEAKELLEKAKPWKTFTQDVLAIENEVLVSHHTPDNIKKQTRKKLRKRGKIVHQAVYEQNPDGTYKRNDKGKRIVKEWVYDKDENGNLIPARGKRLTDEEIKTLKEGEDYFSEADRKTGEVFNFRFVFDRFGKKVYRKKPIYQKGDTVRGALHQETFYGAIEKDIEGNIHKDKTGKLIPQYVIRKEISKLSEGDIKNIVDREVREIMNKAVEKGLLSFKTVKGKKIAVVKEGETIWRNEEKKIPIKKVRCYAYPKELIDIKEHRDKKATHPHKWHYHVQNQTNYCMAIYEGQDKKGNPDRAFELINTLDAGSYFKLSNKSQREQYQLYPEKHRETGYPFKFMLTKGQLALLYVESPNEIWDAGEEKKLERLYVITGLDKDGIKLMHHQEARGTTDVLAYMNDIITQQNLKEGKVDKHGKPKESKLTSPKGGDVIGKYKEFPYIKFKPSGFKALLQGVDFHLTPTGKIEKIEKQHPEQVK